jgi:chromosome segregation ATPase
MRAPAFGTCRATFEAVEPTDLTVRILSDIRDDVRGLREEQRATREELRVFAERTERRFEAMEARFEVIETTLRDLAQQLVVLARGVKVAIEQRSTTDDRLDVLERRVGEIEKKTG